MIQRSLLIGRALGGVLAGTLVSFAAHAANCAAPPVSGKVYNIVNEGSGLFLDVGGARADNGADIIQWTPNGNANQQWTLTKVGDDTWTLRAVHSRKSLDLANWRTDDKAPFKQWETYGQNANQQFLLRSTPSGAFNLFSRHSWKLVTADASGAKPDVYQDSDKSAAGQRWFLNPADGSCNTGGTTGRWGSFMGFDRILIGGAIDYKETRWGASTNVTDTLNKAPWDLRYDYVHSAVYAPQASCFAKCSIACKGWWGCENMSDDGKWNLEAGTKINGPNADNANYFKLPNGQPHRMIHQWSWYLGEDIGKMQGALNARAGRSGSNDYKGGVNNPTLLKGYLDDYRFFLNKIGNSQNIIQLEPDFWGFLRVQDGAFPNDPTKVPAAVRAASGGDCASEGDHVGGLARCLIKMARKYAPRSTVGLHLSCWDINEKDSATRGPKACIRYYQELGAGEGDFLVADVTDRDAAWAALDHPEFGWKAKNYYGWSNDQFTSFLARVKEVTEGVGKPMILWQIPLGNENMSNRKVGENRWQWKDDKVKHFFTRMNEVADAHIVALQFGAGWVEQTSTESDGGYLLWFANEYYRKGGVKLR